MKIALRDVNDFTMVDINDNVDVENVRELEAVLNEAIKTRKLHLVLNLTEVRYLCSHCMSVLIRIWKRLAASSGSIRVIAPDPLIRQMLISTNINMIMGVYPSEPAFLGEMSKRTQAGTFSVRVQSGYQVIEIDRTVGILTGLQELERLIRILIEQGARHIALDLRQSEIFYSEFAGLITKFYWELNKKGGQLALVGVGGMTRDRISILGLDRLIPLWENEIEMTNAIASDEKSAPPA